MTSSHGRAGRGTDIEAGISPEIEETAVESGRIEDIDRVVESFTIQQKTGAVNRSGDLEKPNESLKDE
ncbi:MAG TPA: hypothetical protein VLA12_12010 [Planctomycetaceae bacterium]|nr:hypothetical protein [Planctomycetaceae bacterium]